MTATELEERKAAADKDPLLWRPLFDDFKAYKDEQLSDLTTQVNSYRVENEKVLAGAAEKDAAIAAKESEKLAEIAKKQAELDATVAAKQAEVDAEKARADAVQKEKEELLKPEKLKQIEALQSQEAAIHAQIEKLKSETSETAIAAEPSE